MSRGESAFFWGAVLLIASLALFLGTWFLFRWLRRRIDTADVETPLFTLQDLRDMLARGEINQVEFDSMRAAIIGKFSERGSARSAGRTPPDDAA